jgi:hypothetical protein
MLNKCCAEVAHSDTVLPDISCLMYKNSDTNYLTKWKALRLVEVLYYLSDCMLAKVIYLFTRILQVEVIIPSEGNPGIDGLIQLSDQILGFSTPM